MKINIILDLSEEDIEFIVYHRITNLDFIDGLKSRLEEGGFGKVEKIEVLNES